MTPSSTTTTARAALGARAGSEATRHVAVRGLMAQAGAGETPRADADEDGAGMIKANAPTDPLDFIRDRVGRGIPLTAARVGALLAERDALHELYEDVQRWREGGGDDRDLRYILDTADKLEARYAGKEPV